MAKYIRKTDKVYLKKTGRPSTYKPEFCEDIIEFMSKGNSLTSWCAKQNIWPEVVYEWKRNHVDFSEAYRIARIKFQEADEAKFRRKMEDPDFKHASMMQHWMKVKHRDWRDKTHVTSQNLNVNADVELEKVKMLSDEIEEY